MRTSGERVNKQLFAAEVSNVEEDVEQHAHE
jgi:hypothetical protein